MIGRLPLLAATAAGAVAPGAWAQPAGIETGALNDMSGPYRGTRGPQSPADEAFRRLAEGGCPLVHS